MFQSCCDLTGARKEEKVEALQKLISLPSRKDGQEIRALGIDLGTTNSTAAEVIWKIGEPLQCRVLEVDQPTEGGLFTSPLVPSVVALIQDGTVWVGEGAKRLRTSCQLFTLIPERNLFYETKNDIGLKKSYYQAPEDFNHAFKIGGHILKYIKKEIEQRTDFVHQATSVSVPASFQINQRRDTFLACQRAQLSLQDDDLIDEPTAALIDYILTNGCEEVIQPNRASLCVVFDFGGGTCDVAVVEIVGDRSSGNLTMSQLAVPRYHRLGGGDIDAAIVHACLIPRECMTIGHGAKF